MGFPRNKQFGVFLSVASLLTILSCALVFAHDRAVAAGAPADRSVANFRAATYGGHAWGAETGRHTLVVFSDFACAACRSVSLVIDSVAARFPDVRIIEHNFPVLARQQEARDAAMAAECASSQGRYGAMRRELYSRFGLIESRKWGRLFGFAQIPDTSRAVECIKQGEFQGAIAADSALGRELGIERNPAVILDGRLFGRPPSFAVIKALLDSMSVVKT